MTKPNNARTLPTPRIFSVVAFITYAIALLGLTGPASASAIDGIREYIYSFFDSEEDQIRKGLEDHLRTHPGECLVYGNWPLNRMFGQFMPPEQVTALTESGIAVFETRKGYWDNQKGSLTELGRRHYFPNQQETSFPRRKGAICVGRRELESIDEYTVPSQIMGKTVTQVHYRYHLADIPEWAIKPEIIKAFPEGGRRIAAHDRTFILPQGPTTQDASDTVVLLKTNNGWRAATRED